MRIAFSRIYLSYKQTGDCSLILVILLVQSSEDSPGIGVALRIRVLLQLRFECENRIERLALSDEFKREMERVLMRKVRIPRLELIMVRSVFVELLLFHVRCLLPSVTQIPVVTALLHVLQYLRVVSLELLTEFVFVQSLLLVLTARGEGSGNVFDLRSYIFSCQNFSRSY